MPSIDQAVEQARKAVLAAFAEYLRARAQGRELEREHLYNNLMRLEDEYYELKDRT